MSHADKFCIVAIDEFQQIAKYPEKNIEALLRTHIQRSENSHFIFAGSERHMMQEMFASAARPFYHSADMLELKAIPAEIYIPFIVGHFERRNRSIAAVDVEKVYALFRGTPTISKRPSTNRLPIRPKATNVRWRRSGLPSII